MKRLISIPLIAVTVILSVYAQSDLNKADMQYAMRAYTSAIESYKDVLKHDTQNQDIYARIARCYVQLQDNLQASQWYEKIIDRKDLRPEYLLEYAHLLKALRLYAKAKFYYQKYGVYDIETAHHFVQSCDLAKSSLQGPEFYTIRPLKANTPETEYAPWPYRGDLVFNSFRTDVGVLRSTEDQSAGLDAHSGLFIAGGADGALQGRFKSGVKNGEGISHVRLSADGKWVAYHKSDFRPGQRLFDDRPGKLSLFVGEVSDDGVCSGAQAFTFNSNDFATGYPALSEDGTLLYFASTRPGGYGGWDLYVSFRTASGWSAPQNLGSVVNTKGNEIAPYFTNQTLYFSSDWHAGAGGFDVFQAKSHNGQWTSVQAMAYPINTSKDDLDFIWLEDKKMGIVTSNRVGGQGEYDIYMCKPDFSEVSVVVMDQTTHTPLKGVEVRFEGSKFPVAVTDVEGTAVVPQTGTGTQQVVLSLPGFRELPMKFRPGTGRAPVYEIFMDPLVETEEAPQIQEEVAAGDTPPEKDISSEESHDEVQGHSSKEEVTTPDTGADQTREASKESAVEPGPVVESTRKTSANPVPRKEVGSRAPGSSGKFAVQVAALGKMSSLTKYEPLEQYGAVMQYPEGRFYKIRVGYFDSEHSAKTALGKIKDHGYPDAFIVRANPDTEETRAESTQTDSYMVRLGTYSRPGHFDSARVDHLGRIESYRKNDLTIMLLAGYASFSEAENARVEAVRLGFKDAYVVQEVNGQFVRARQ